MTWFKRSPLRILRLLPHLAWRSRGTLARAFVCLLAGIVTLWITTGQSFDLRFQLRSINRPSPDIVIINFDRDDFSFWNSSSINNLMGIKELNLSGKKISQHPIWQDFLAKLDKLQPSAIGLSFFIDSPNHNYKNLISASRVDSEGRVVFPNLTRYSSAQTGLTLFESDKDGRVRTFNSPLTQVSHMALMLAQFKTNDIDYTTSEKRLINFQGPDKTYTHVSFSDVIAENIRPEQIKNKIIIVGNLTEENHQLRTPIGIMSRAELMANVVDNFINDKWIKRLDMWVNIVLLFGFLLLCLYIIRLYPHSMAFVFLLWICLSYSAISLWVFDTYNVWTPIVAPIVQTSIVFLTFMSFQLTLKDTLNWKLEQEKKYLFEVERLKDNFVSLFSHDLKTPIAKIQAICDRLMSENPDEKLNSDLLLLRKESQELHRYIQSILQITRVEAKDFKITKESADINEIIESVIEQLKPLADKKGQVINLDLEPLFLIEIDATLIREVALNLIENAIKYSPEGVEIKIATYEKNDKVFLSVEDQGAGIPLSEQKKVFDRFYRGESQLNQSKGSGLGLYLAKYFIELHGGNIWLECPENKGTKVQFSLPV